MSGLNHIMRTFWEVANRHESQVQVQVQVQFSSSSLLLNQQNFTKTTLTRK